MELVILDAKPFKEISKRLYSRIDPQNPLPSLIIRTKNLNLFNFMNNFLITADNLSYKINEKKLFKNITFFFVKVNVYILKDLMVLGNQHYLRIILGITSPTKGSINNGVKKTLAYLGHKNALKSYLSVEDNILLMGLSAHKELKRYLEILSLKDLLDIKVANLSYGQQKKLAF